MGAKIAISLNISSESVPRHRVHGHVIFFRPAFFFDEFADLVRDGLAVGALFKRDIDRRSLSVPRDYAADEHRVLEKLFAQAFEGVRVAGGLRHQGAYLQRPVLDGDIVYGGETGHIPGGHSWYQEYAVA